MTDSWKLRELFKFDSEYLRVFNDTDRDVEYVDPRNQVHKISYNGIINFPEQNKNFDIPNLDTIRYTDKCIYKHADFDENLQIITRWYRNQIKDGQIKQGIDFLEYHYKWTKRKKRKDFISFVKYYFLSKYWLPKEQREKDWLVEEWIKSKEVERERPKYFWVVGLIVVLLILGIVFLCEYRELLIGSLLGLFLGRADKLIDKIFGE